jgi:uncharacterized protein involved in response to NO
MSTTSSRARSPTIDDWFPGIAICLVVLRRPRRRAGQARLRLGGRRCARRCVAFGLLQAVRHGRWAGDRALADRLVLVLHVAYAFVLIGFLLPGAAVVWPAIFPASAGIHAWMAGAAGLMTLAVMTRASLGHAGQELAASVPTQLIFLGALIAALARIIRHSSRRARLFISPPRLGFLRSAALSCFLGGCSSDNPRSGTREHRPRTSVHWPCSHELFLARETVGGRCKID